MSWNGGIKIFDGVVKEILKSSAKDKEKVKIIRKLARALDANDWDNHGESQFFDHPIVREATPEWSDE